MFEKCSELFEAYYAGRESDPDFNTRAGIEFGRRLRQLDYFLSEVRRRDEIGARFREEMGRRMERASQALAVRGLTWSDTWPADIKADFERPHAASTAPNFDLPFEVEAHAEAFYFVVGRIQDLLRKDKDGRRTFPGLGDLKFDGAIRVRNKLIQHHQPDGTAARGIGAMFAFGGDNGPVLRLEQAEEVDAGLYVNAKGLARELESKLHSALRNRSK